MKLRPVFPFLLFLVWSTSNIAQLALDERFSNLLKSAGLELLEPLEAKYKAVPVYKNTYQTCDYTIRSRKEKLEISYLIKPFEENKAALFAPHVQCMRMVTHLATNREDALISWHGIEESVLKEDFNADWGQVIFFQPKRDFSSKTHCKMLAMYREGKGMAFVFFLFDEASQGLDKRFVALRFTEAL